MLRDAFKSKLTDKEKYELEQERINKSLGEGQFDKMEKL